METKPKESFDPIKHLKEPDREKYDYVVQRIKDLQDNRKQEKYGVNMETIWSEADRDYSPHRLGTTGKKILVQDEEKGWASTITKLGSSGWQSDVSMPNVFTKINTAISILIDKNPTAVFSPGLKKYQSTTELHSQLYKRSWEIAKSKQQLKLFAFNLAKYGWACARTYPLLIKNNGVVEYDDVFRENLDPWNVWIDDEALPNNQFSLNDWCYRKVYSMDKLKMEFGDSPYWKYVQAGGIITDKITGKDNESKKYIEKDKIEVYFYENKVKYGSLYMAIANKAPLMIEELPIEDVNGAKKLTLWDTYWLLRHAQCREGIGIYESMRYDQAMLDRFRNMTIDQLTMSIYKMFFYTGTNTLTETGDIKITPGLGKQIMNPKDINWIDVPGPGAEAWKGIEMFKQDTQESSGILDNLQGMSDEKTAYQSAMSKESALKRLKTPLDNICDALETEATITLCVNSLIYSEPEVYAMTDPELIERYIKDVQGDPSLFSRTTDENGQEIFNAKVYPEVPLNLEKDEKGNLIETKDTKFFRVKPGSMIWDGVISVKAQSILTPSKQLDRTMELEMYNLLIPLFMQDPEKYTKTAKNICKLYDKDPKEVIPDSWLQGTNNDLIIPMPQQLDANGQPISPMAMQGQTGMTQAQKFQTQSTLPATKPTTQGEKMIGQLVKPLVV